MVETLTRSAEGAAPDDPAKQGQIIAGAKRVFLERGYEGASMSLIAREAGVSKGTLYVYFTNKEALFAAFIQTECRLQSREVFELLDGARSARDVLPQFGRHFLQFLIAPDTHAIRRLVAAESAKFPELGRAFYEAGPRVGLRMLKDFLTRRIEAGELDIDDPALAASQFMNLCHGELTLMRQMNVIETATPQRIGYIVDQAVRVFLAAHAAYL